MSTELDEIWSLYAQDGAEALDAAEVSLADLRADGGDREAAATLFRALHTFKGNARVVGLGTLEKVVHRAEDLLGLVRDDDGGFDDSLAILLEEALDDFRAWLEESAHERRDIAPEAVVELVTRLESAVTERRLRSGSGVPIVGARHELAAMHGAPFESAIIFDESDASLADDAEYRAVFYELAAEEIGKMCAATRARSTMDDEARGSITAALGRLRFAAEQIGFSDWVERLGRVVDAETATLHEIVRATAALQERLHAEVAGLSPTADRVPPFERRPASPSTNDDRAELRRFLGQISIPLAAIAAFGRAVADDANGGRSTLARATAELRCAAESAGIVCLESKFDAVLSARGAEEFQAAEFELYEALAAVEERAVVDGSHGGSVTAVLRAWCTDHAGETLDELATLIEALDARKPDNARRVARSKALLSRLHVACTHYGFETAGELTMVLADLCARLDSGELVGHALLVQVMRAFISALDPLLEAAAEGISSDTEEIDALVRKAAAVTFAERGTVTSSEMERRLGLPASFHKVLTAESVASAQKGLDAGENFFVVRANLGDDASLSMRFMRWVSGDGVRNISNVTVFGGDGTLFDFLIAGSFDVGDLTEALAVVDPTRRLVRLESALRVAQDSVVTPATVGLGDVPHASAGGNLAVSTFETIGEAVTRQAALHQAIVGMSDADLSRKALGEFDANRDDPVSQRAALELAMSARQAELANVAHQGAQLLELLERLQEEVLALRGRSSSLLLRPLVTLAAITASREGREIDVTIVGEDVTLDATTLEVLHAPARALVGYSVAHSVEPPVERERSGKAAQARVVVRTERRGERVIFSVEDDGSGGATGSRTPRHQGDSAASLDDVTRDAGLDFAQLRRQLALQGAELVLGSSCLGGFGASIAVSLGFVVVDAMVVRIASILYVIPVAAIHRIVSKRDDDLVRVPGRKERCVLPLEGNTLVDVRCLPFNSAKERPSLQHSLTAERTYVLLGAGATVAALAIDELVGQELVLTRPLRGVLSEIRGVTSCAVIGTGAVGMVIDVPRFLEER